MGEIPSAYQSVYLALHVPSLQEGGKGKKESKKGVDNVRMEKKMRTGKRELNNTMSVTVVASLDLCTS